MKRWVMRWTATSLFKQLANRVWSITQVSSATPSVALPSGGFERIQFVKIHEICVSLFA